MWPLNFPVNWNNIKICHFLSPCFALFLLIWRFFLIMRVYSNKQASIHNLALSFAYPFPFQPFIQLLSLFLSLLVTSFSFSIFLFLLPLLFSFRFKLSLFSIPYFWFPFSPSNTCKTYSTVFVSSTSFIVLFPSFLCLCLSPSPGGPPFMSEFFNCHTHFQTFLFQMSGWIQFQIFMVFTRYSEWMRKVIALH